MVVTDVSAGRVAAVRPAHPSVEVVADTDALVGRTSTSTRRARSAARADRRGRGRAARRRLVCGGANNQLAHPGVEDLLAARGILYAPDYCVNAGGVIQVADELHGFDFARARGQGRARSSATTARVLATAAGRGHPAGHGGRPAGRAADGRGGPAAG